MKHFLTALALVAALLAPARAHAADPPNMKPTVQAVFDAAPWDLTTHNGSGCFTEAVVYRLHELAPGQWFHLKKSGGQNQYNGHAVDAVLHVSGYAVDMIGSSASAAAKPAWTLDRVDATGGPRYANRPELRIVPTKSCAPDGLPPVTPPPASNLEARVDDLTQRIASLSGQLAVMNEQFGQLAQVVNQNAVALQAVANELTTEQENRKTVDSEHDRVLNVIKSRPIPDGCKTQFVSCRLTFNAPPIE